eukprot:jgi/Ulvmu1/1475/UM011_0205.1
MSLRVTHQGAGRNVGHQIALRPKATIRAPAAHANPKLPPWDVMWGKLLENKLESLTPEAAKSRVDSGEWVVVDVRPKEEYKKSSIEGAVNAPLFQLMDWGNATPASFLRGAAYALNGVQAVEINANFADDVKSQADGKKVIMCCDTGGSMRPSANFVTGKTSRSLKAAFRVVNEGLADEVAHLDGGMVAWVSQGLPTAGEYDASIAGRSPNSAADAVFPTSGKETANK